MISTFILASLAIASTASARPSTPPVDVNLSAADACSIDHNTGFHDDKASHTIQSGGRDRTYAVQVPPSYNDGTRQHWPVIFDYHGSTQTATQQAATSQYNLTSEGQQYLVIYPQGVDCDWEGANYSTKGVNDTQFTTDLLAHIEATYCIDTTRVYASGKSNGGGFVDLLACSDAGDSFHAFAMAAPALYMDTSYASCSKKRPILQSHGTADNIIRYTGGSGRGGQLPDIDAWTGWWGRRDCGSKTQADEYFTAAPKHTKGDGWNTTSFSCHGFDDVVTSYKIFGAGHCWPASGSNLDTQSQKNDSCKDTELSFTAKVLEFFGNWNQSKAEQLSQS